MAHRIHLRSYEGHLLDAYGISLKKTDRTFELLHDNETIYSIRNDFVGSIGFSILAAMAEQEESELPIASFTNYAPVNIADLFKAIDVGGVALVATKYNDLGASEILELTPKVLALPNYSKCSTAEKTIMLDYLASVITFYTQLRKTGKAVTVCDTRLNNQSVTMEDLRQGKKYRFANIVPLSGANTFSDDSEERELVLAYAENTHKLCSNGIRQFYAPVVDAFLFISDCFQDIPPLPNFTALEAASPSENGESDLESAYSASNTNCFQGKFENFHINVHLPSSSAPSLERNLPRFLSGNGRAQDFSNGGTSYSIPSRLAISTLGGIGQDQSAGSVNFSFGRAQASANNSVPGNASPTRLRRGLEQVEPDRSALVPVQFSSSDSDLMEHFNNKDPFIIIKHFWKRDLNNNKHFGDLKEGGFSIAAKKTFASLSKGKVQGMMYGVAEYPTHFHDMIVTIARNADLDPRAAGVAELISCRLVLAKSTFTVDMDTKIFQRTMSLSGGRR